MMTTGYEYVVGMVNMLLEAEKVAQMSDSHSSAWNEVYVTNAVVQTDGPNGCCSLAASELLDPDLLVRMTSGPYNKICFHCTHLRINVHGIIAVQGGDLTFSDKNFDRQAHTHHNIPRLVSQCGKFHKEVLTTFYSPRKSRARDVSFHPFGKVFFMQRRNVTRKKSF